MRAYYLGDYATATRCLKQSLRLDREKDAAYYYLSRIYEQQGRSDKARKYLQKALRLSPGNYWYGLREAGYAMEQGEWDRAEQCYLKLAAQYPRKVQLLYELINLYMMQNQDNKVLTVLDKIEQLEGKSEQSVLLRFSILSPTASATQQAELAQELQDFAGQNPTPRVWTLLADFNASRDSLATALTYYDHALSLDPGFMPALYGQAETFRVRRQFDKFFESMNSFLASPQVEPEMKNGYMKQLLESRGFVGTFMPQVDTLFLSMRKAASPQDSTLAYLYATYLAQTGRPLPAQQVLEENATVFPQDAYAQLQVLAIMYYRKDWEALAAYAAGLQERFPENIDVRSLYGIALSQLKHTRQAIDCFLAVLPLIDKKDKANLVQTYTLLGDLYHEAGDLAQCFEWYNKVLHLDPGNVPVLNNYAYFLCLQQTDLEKALEMSAKTIEAEPKNATYLDTYAWILHLLGRTAEAKDVLRQALAYGGKESAEILHHYGDVLNALNEPLIATIYWKQAYQIEPSEELKAKIDAHKP